MRTTRLLGSWSLLWLTLWGASLAQAAPQDTAAETFERLRSLVGVWEGKFSNGRVHTVTYRMTAGDTVLVETWALAPGRESMTLYHMDGAVLIATHYCPAGNQPTLQLVIPTNPDQLRFEFRSATNLPDPSANHQHRFELRLLNDNSYWRSETYTEGSQAETEAVTYTRVSGATEVAPHVEPKKRE